MDELNLMINSYIESCDFEYQLMFWMSVLMASSCCEVYDLILFQVLHVAVSPRGSWIASVCSKGTLKVWTVGDGGKEVTSLPIKGTVKTVAFSHVDMQLLVSFVVQNESPTLAGHAWGFDLDPGGSSSSSSN